MRNTPKVNVKGAEYNLYFKESNFLSEEGYNVQGVTNQADKTITVRIDLDNYSEEMLVRHELTHAYLHQCGMLDYCSDETLVDCLSKIIPEIEHSTQKVMKIIQGVQANDSRRNIKESTVKFRINTATSSK